MNDANPYQPPTAQPNQTLQDTYRPAFFSLHGRIGRARFFCYQGGYMFLYLFLVLAIKLLTTLDISTQLFPLNWESYTTVSSAITHLPLLALYFVLFRRRLNDMNLDAFFLLPMLIPVINYLFMLYLMVWRGNEGPNDFGLPAQENKVLKVIAILVAGLAVVGIAAALLLPVYQSYTTGG